MTPITPQNSFRELFRFPTQIRRTRGKAHLFVGGAAALLALLLAACAEKKQNLSTAYRDPCTAMKLEITEKRELDAKVKKLAKQAEKYRKSGDTASAASADRRLIGLRENQRLLKESLDQSGNECRSTMGDPLPVRGPASQDPTKFGN
jgi:hypothetical protein